MDERQEFAYKEIQRAWRDLVARINAISTCDIEPHVEVMETAGGDVHVVLSAEVAIPGLKRRPDSAV